VQHDKQSGKQLKQAYADHGLAMLPEKATFSDGSYGLEAGVTRMLERMEAGTLKIFSHLHDWLEEFAIYHRKDGVIVKESGHGCGPAARRARDCRERFERRLPNRRSRAGG
jgi:terminase large subunit-like protein